MINEETYDATRDKDCVINKTMIMVGNEAGDEKNVSRVMYTTTT